MRENNLGCMVISIGNLTVGGTGKTPVVELFARSLADRGRNVAVLSRGYKSQKPPLLRRLKNKMTGGTHSAPPRVVSDGKNVLLDSRKAGDEPFMLATNLKNVPVVVDKDRVKGGNYTCILISSWYASRTLLRTWVITRNATSPRSRAIIVPCTSPWSPFTRPVIFWSASF